MTLRYLALGDSYTIGEGVQPEDRWPSRLAVILRQGGEDMADPEIVAVTGWTTDELSAGIDAAAPEGPYDLVTLLIGVNDQYRGRAPLAYAERFEPLLERAVAFAGGDPGRVVVVSIPDWGVSPFAVGRDRAAIARELDEFNGIARSTAGQRGARWVDVTAASRAAGDAPEAYADDGLHPSGAAYAEWARLVAPAARLALGVHEHHIRVQRSARWYQLGQPTPAVREIWLVVHGYAQLARDFVAAFEPIAAPERLIVAPEALSRFYTASERGTSHRQVAVGASWMTREDREAEVLDYVDYLDAVLARTRAAAPNATRVVALGFSQGTATVSRWAVLGATAPDRLILWGGGPAEDLDPARVAERFAGMPIELVHGTNDRIVPLSVVEETAARFRARGAAMPLRTFDGGHRIDRDVLIEVANQ